MVAGGVGFTPMAPFLTALLDPVRRAAALPGLRRLLVVWAVQELAHATWFEVRPLCLTALSTESA